MDTLTRHPRFPSIRMRCPKSSPKFVIPAAALRRNCGDAGGETPVGRIDTVRWNGADGTPPKRVVNFSDFLSAGSKVLRVTIAGNHPSPTTATNCLLTEIRDGSVPLPVSVWGVKSGWTGSDEGDESSLFFVYRTHEQACEALRSQTTSLHFNFFPALDADLHPFAKLQRIHLERPPPASSFPQQPPFSLEMNSPIISLPPPSNLSPPQDLVAPMPHKSGAFVLSSNPPNPKANFRVGDWICPLVSCAAHNFGRNSSCIGCGASRPAIGSLAVHQLGRVPPPQRFSPRFSNMEPSHDQTDILIGPATHTPIHHPSHTSKSPVPIQLTPSGTQICMGGKVRNISNDALAPCYMFWSFNEPLPDQGQIRPALAVALQHPPILNTGNRGPIEHQPGDWICKKCNYLNWRRRKVCQTCYPYAEGNGDSIPATVQAERIALLASTIRGRESHSLPPSPSCLAHERPLRRSSLPLQALATAQRPINDVCRHDDQHPIMPRSRSNQPEWFLKTRQSSPSIASHGPENLKTLYQTSFGNGSSPLFVPGATANSPNYPGPSPSGPLLPSFLQDIVQSPSLSPASSADFSLEDQSIDEPEPRFSKFNEGSANIPYHGLKLHSSLALRSTTSLSNIYNIWKLGGDETKGW